MSKLVRCLCVLFVFAACALPARSDSNLHTIAGTMTGCGCEYYTATQDWVCHARIEMDDPPQHFSAESLAAVTVELTGQAIGQCGAIQADLPRATQVLFWLDGGGIDYVRGILRSSAHAYYIIDAGPAD